ncbi:MAG: hypothetical protein M3Y57_14965 [Acidobacteriota bacterium]|nr:hypothetical protein [Acidobacteriota bacterium]
MAALVKSQAPEQIGREMAIPYHLQDGEEFDASIPDLIQYGKKLFEARFTIQEGAGRPLTKGTRAPPRTQAVRCYFRVLIIAFPDRNPTLAPVVTTNRSRVEPVICRRMCSSPGSGSDFATFNANDVIPTRGGTDERGNTVTLQSIADSRSTVDMFGAGYYEMLARQISADLQRVRDAIPNGGQAALHSKSISFGILARNIDGTWNTSAVEGLPPQSLASADAQHPPNLLILPFHQGAGTVSLRVFTNDAFNQHHGMQSTILAKRCKHKKRFSP